MPDERVGMQVAHKAEQGRHQHIHSSCPHSCSRFPVQSILWAIIAGLPTV